MYNKRVLKKATDNLDKAKSPAKPKDIIVDPKGQWEHPGQNTRIPGGNITMQGVPYPVLAQPNIGQPQMMYPGMEYQFPGADYVDEFPQMQEGGTNVTKLSPEEELEFQRFYNTLPDNLQSDDNTYDIRGYWDSEGRPSEFNYSQPKEKDGYYHAYSINSNTGEYLKSPAHETFQHAVDEDRKMGWRPITNVYGRNIATYNESIADPEQQSFLRNTEGPANYIEADLTDEEIEEYRKGGYIVEDISVPELTKAQKGAATQADSLSVYNNALRQKAYYDKLKPYYRSVDINPWDNMNTFNVLKDMQRQHLNYDAYDDKLNRYMDVKKKAIKANKDPNKLYLLDMVPNLLDPYAPLLEYNKNIKPQGVINYRPKETLEAEDKLPGWVTTLPYYDPLAIKPGNMLTPAEVKARVKKYGTRGIPASKLKGVIPASSKSIKKGTASFDPYAHSKTKVEPKIIGIPPEKNTDPTKMFVGTTEIKSYDENGNPVTSIEYIYDDVRLPIKKLEEYIPTAERVPQDFPTQVKPEQANMAFRYRNQWQHAYDPSSGKFKTYGTKQATLPYGEKINEHQWEYNKSDELPESGHHVWQVGNKKYYNEEEAKAAAAQWDAEHSYQFKKGGSLLTKKVTCKKCGWKWDAADGGNDITTCHKCGGQGLVHAQLGKSTTATLSPYSLNANAIPLASKVFGEYDPELLLGINQKLPSKDARFKHDVSLDLGLPYTGKFVPSAKANYHGAFISNKPSESGLFPSVHSDLQLGYDPQQGLNFGVMANPRADFGNKEQGVYLRQNWPHGAWKGYAGILGGLGYRGRGFNQDVGVGDIGQEENKMAGRALLGYGANAGFEMRPFRHSPLRVGADASLVMSPTKSAGEAGYAENPVGYTPTVKAKLVYPLGVMRPKRKMGDEDIFIDRRPIKPDDGMPDDGRPNNDIPPNDDNEPTKRIKGDRKKRDYEPISFFGDLPVGYLPGYDPETGREVPESYTRNAYEFGQGPTMYKKGGSKSKKYTRSLEGKNEVFDENKLFKKLKNQRKKIFNPRAKHYQDGGEIELNLTPEEIQDYIKAGYVVESFD